MFTLYSFEGYFDFKHSFNDVDKFEIDYFDLIPSFDSVDFNDSFDYLEDNIITNWDEYDTEDEECDQQELEEELDEYYGISLLFELIDEEIWLSETCNILSFSLPSHLGLKVCNPNHMYPNRTLNGNIQDGKLESFKTNDVIKNLKFIDNFSSKYLSSDNYCVNCLSACKIEYLDFEDFVGKSGEFSEAEILLEDRSLEDILSDSSECTEDEIDCVTDLRLQNFVTEKKCTKKYHKGKSNKKHKKHKKHNHKRNKKHKHRKHKHKK